ncbi:unnamed protein product [Hermetia illucens]|uniref:Uncharacterized protein n=1 Tax=Hermetia illucens TaxID=343691 RepID=A0A7R8UUA1_HERIL|nr:unnamed protein product [Hermetia illucens]
MIKWTLLLVLIASIAFIGMNAFSLDEDPVGFLRTVPAEAGQQTTTSPNGRRRGHRGGHCRNGTSTTAATNTTS